MLAPELYSNCYLKSCDNKSSKIFTTFLSTLFRTLHWSRVKMLPSVIIFLNLLYWIFWTVHSASIMSTNLTLMFHNFSSFQARSWDSYIFTFPFLQIQFEKSFSVISFNLFVNFNLFIYLFWLFPFFFTNLKDHLNER